jgi:FtsK/SpoIIIE family
LTSSVDYRKPPLPFPDAAQGQCQLCGAFESKTEMHPECRRRWRLMSDQSALRSFVYQRDAGVCIDCANEGVRAPHRQWQADHPVPLWLQRYQQMSPEEILALFDPDAVATRCVPHHKAKTKQESRDRSLLRSTNPLKRFRGRLRVRRPRRRVKLKVPRQPSSPTYRVIWKITAVMLLPALWGVSYNRHDMTIKWLIYTAAFLFTSLRVRRSAWKRRWARTRIYFGLAPILGYEPQLMWQRVKVHRISHRVGSNRRIEIVPPPDWPWRDEKKLNGLVVETETRLGGRWMAEPRPTEGRLVVQEMHPLPHRVAYEPDPHPSPNRLYIGASWEGRQHLVLSGARETPHILIVGATGSGKTVLLRTIAISAVRAGFSVWCADPKRIELRCLRGRQGIERVETSPAGMTQLVRDARAEMDRRYVLIEDEGLDPGLLPPMMIIVDEVTQLLAETDALRPRGRGAAGEQAAPLVLDDLAALGRKARGARMHLALGLQRPDTKIIQGELRDNIGARIAMGQMSDDGFAMVFGHGQMDEVKRLSEPISGRGLLDTGTALLPVQVAWVPDPFRDKNKAAQQTLDRLLPIA